MLKELICQDCGRVRKDITERFWVSRMEKDFTREWCAKCTPEKYRTVGHIAFLKEFPDGIEPIPEPERERWEYLHGGIWEEKRYGLAIHTRINLTKEFEIFNIKPTEGWKEFKEREGIYLTNELGMMGWELVSVDNNVAYFKRRLIE